MRGSAFFELLSAPISGANVDGMTKPTKPPAPMAKFAKEKRLSITLDPLTHEQVQFIADVWNASDEGEGLRQLREWGVSNVSPHLVRAAVAGLLKSMGGYPSTAEERAQKVASVRAEVQADAARKQQK